MILMNNMNNKNNKQTMSYSRLNYYDRQKRKQNKYINIFKDRKCNSTYIYFYCMYYCEYLKKNKIYRNSKVADCIFSKQKKEIMIF